MSKSALNTSLQRTLKKGTQYNALFLASNCTPTYLGKGDTEYGINQIKDWVLQDYKNIDTKLARKLFVGSTVQETAANIHSFLYNHFQYDADGYKQNLRSAGCSWASRHTGIDCKSYSILASILLLKCGVKNILRRIQQPSFKPTEYTHIYVIVPKNQETANLSEGYYCVDGTIPTMYEPNHINPHDIIMNLPYYGLKGATTQQQSNNNPTTQQQVFIQGITPFVSKENLVKINDYITRLIKAGVTPIYTQSKIGFKVNDLDIPVLSGMNGTDSADGTDGTDDSTGVDWQETYDTISTSGWYNETFGAIFSNGWNFSCWGSSYSPEKAKNEINIKTKYALDYLGNNPTFEDFRAFQIHVKQTEGGANRAIPEVSASCSKDGYRLLAKGMAELRERVFAELRNFYDFELVATDVLTDYTHLFNHPRTAPDAKMSNQRWADNQPEYFRYDEYKLIPKQNGGTDVDLEIITDNNNSTGNNNPTGNLESPTTHTAGTSKLFGGILLLAAAGYAYKTYAGNNKNNNKKTQNKDAK